MPEFIKCRAKSIGSEYRGFWGSVGTMQNTRKRLTPNSILLALLALQMELNWFNYS